MISKIEFGQCLEELLSILNISGIKLAKAINVDPSLVSKWRNGKRVVSSKSNYIELISDYISKSIKNDYQKKELIKFINSLDISLLDEDSSNLQKYIYRILSVTNQISTQKHLKTINEAPYSKNRSSLNANDNLHIYKNTITPYNATELNVPNNPTKTFELIVGHRNVIHAGIDLLKSVLNRPCCTEEPIIVTFFTEQDSFSSFEETYLEWNKVLVEVLNKGWRVIKIIRLSENLNRNLKIINEIETCFHSDTYYPYYLNNYNLLGIPCEYIIVPEVGSLSCIGSQGIYKFDSAFLVKDKQSTEIQSQHIKLLLKPSSPLLNACEPIRSLKTCSTVPLIEESNGDRYSFMYNLSVLTIPLNLYKKKLFLNPNKMSDEEIQKRISLHKRRIDAFIKQIKHYRYYNIYSKKAIVKLLSSGDYACVRAKPSEVLIHIENVIHMLEKYDNYHIALFNDIEDNNVSKTSWSIKDGHNVLLQNCDTNTNVGFGTASYANYNSGLSATISEPTIVNAFKHYFMNLWSEIPPIDKTKKSVISWFKNQIKGMK